MSNVYMGPLTLPAGATTLKAKAFQPEWSPSATLTAVCTVDATPPSVETRAFPDAIAGWHGAPLTLSFACADANGVASCPGPTTVTQEGIWTITATATDVAGNATPVNRTVQVDLTPPQITLSSPPANVTTTDASIVLVGTVSDGQSGVSAVQCNGAAATVAAGTATCTVQLQPGRNSLVMLVRDGAGHVASRGVQVTRTGTSSALMLSPATRTLLLGESASFALMDDFGTPVAGAAWTTSDPTIAALSADDPPRLTALAAGTATIAATLNGLAANATVSVIAGTSLPDGTTTWMIPSALAQPRPPIYPHRVDDTVPDVFLADGTGSGYGSDCSVRAARADGTLLWTEAVPGCPVFGDIDGGVVAMILSDDEERIRGLARVAGPAGAPPWRYESPGQIEPTEAFRSPAPAGGTYGHYRPASAQAPDGTIYVVEFLQSDDRESRIVAIDGTTGLLRAAAYLPQLWSRFPGGDYVARNQVAAPVIGEDGAAYVLYVTRRRTMDWTYLPNSQTFGWTVGAPEDGRERSDDNRAARVVLLRGGPDRSPGRVHRRPGLDDRSARARRARRGRRCPGPMDSTSVGTKPRTRSVIPAKLQPQSHPDRRHDGHTGRSGRRSECRPRRDCHERRRGHGVRQAARRREHPGDGRLVVDGQVDRTGRRTTGDGHRGRRCSACRRRNGYAIDCG